MLIKSISCGCILCEEHPFLPRLCNEHNYAFYQKTKIQNINTPLKLAVQKLWIRANIHADYQGI